VRTAIRRPLLYILAVLLILTWIAPSSPAAAEPTEGHLPVWEEGFTWSYFVDHDVDYDLMDIKVDHIKENWTRTLYKVLDVDGEKVYKVWEERRGTMRGKITYGLTFTITVAAFGSGWTLIRASDMAVINQTFNLTFTGDLPMGLGKFTGGFHNVTTYDPPMPMLEFPVPTTEWNTVSTVNITTEFFILQPIQNTTWYHSSEVWDLDVTATGPASMTVPADTYQAYTVQEVGTISNATDSWPVDRTWYYADEATNIIKTFEGHVLVWTDAYYTPPNSPPEGPADAVHLSTDEDVSLDIDLAGYFSDPDGDALTFDLEPAHGAQLNSSMLRNGHVWTLTPGANWSGQLDLLATATDPFGQFATGDIVVDVAPVNDPPRVVWEPHDLATEEDMPLRAAHDVADVFADVDGDTLYLMASATEGVMVFMNGTMVDLLPDPDWTGRATITLNATDPSGEVASTSFELMVGEVNDAPSIVSSGGPARIHETEEGVFWVEVVDTDSEDLEFTWSVEGLVAVGIDGPSFTYAPGDLTVSSVTVALVVADNWNDEASVSWEVTIMDSPWIVSSGPSPSVSASVGDTVTFSIEVQDADTSDPTIRWTWEGALVGSGEELPMMFGARDVGVGRLRVVVDDGIGNDSEEWTVTVTVPNEPPTVSIDFPSDGSKVLLGDTITFKAIVSDEDVDNLTVRWSVDGSPVGVGPEHDFTLARVGTLVIQASVSDGEHTVTDTVSVEVEEPEDPPGNGDGSSLGSVWIALVLVAVIIAVMVLVFLRTRPDRQG